MSHTSTAPSVHGILPAEWSFLRCLASSLGFAAVGIARAGKVRKEHTRRYDQFIAREYHADMVYLAEHRSQRFDLGHEGIVEGASAIIVAALPFGEGARKTGIWQHVAAYARGCDYHKTMRDKLGQLAEATKSRFPSCRSRIFVDTAPIMERTWALASGIGALGKNGQVMIPGWGSKILLGEVVCAGVPSPESIEIYSPFELCGDCSKCMDSCPTKAIVAPAVVDSRRCLSYWTIENRKDEIPGQISDRAEQVFGCDKCIRPCPVEDYATTTALEPPPSRASFDTSLEELSKLDDKKILELVRGTSLERTGPWALRRNAQMLVTSFE